MISTFLLTVQDDVDDGVDVGDIHLAVAVHVTLLAGVIHGNVIDTGRS